MADSPLTEALAEYDEFGFVGVHQQDALAAAARRWAELEALVADGGRVVVETRNPLWLRQYGSEWKRRIVLGEGATDAV